MTAEPCRGRRGDVAAYALGLLEPDDATRTLAHLDGCPTCRAALAELRSTAAVLSRADPERIDSQPRPPTDLGERVHQRVLDDRHAHENRLRRRRLRTTLASVAAAVVLFAVAVAFVANNNDDPSFQAFAVAEAGVTGEFALESNDQGTAVIFEHRGLDPDEVYWLWLTDDTGHRVSAGTFHGSGDTTRVTLQSAMPEPSAVRIWVTDASDEVVLDSPITR